MSNKSRITLFAVFVLLTFYQFYNYAKGFRLSDFIPLERPSVLYGTFLTTSSPNPLSQIDFAIPLLALNVLLLIEPPSQVGRRPLVLAFIANLSLMIIRVGFGNPAIKKYLADLQNNSAAFRSPFPQWNALYLVIATISALIVLGVGIRHLRRENFIFPYISHGIGMFRIWNATSFASKTKLALFLVFTLLTFYQFVSHAKPVQRDPSQLKDAINKIAVSQNGRADIRVVVTSPSNSVSPIPFLVLMLNIILWANYPQQIGRLLFTLSFLANLAIVLIQNIDKAVFQQSGGFQGMGIEARFLQLDQLDNLYRILATISALIVVGMLLQVWRKRQFRPYSLR